MGRLRWSDLVLKSGVGYDWGGQGVCVCVCAYCCLKRWGREPGVNASTLCHHKWASCILCVRLCLYACLSVNFNPTTSFSCFKVLTGAKFPCAKLWPDFDNKIAGCHSIERLFRFFLPFFLAFYPLLKDILRWCKCCACTYARIFTLESCTS